MKGKRVRKNRVISRHNPDNGKIIRLRSHPPPFTAAPWYNLVVRIRNFPGSFTAIVLRDSIISQLGLPPTFSSMCVRLQKIRIWGALGQNLNSVSAIIRDPIAIATSSSSAPGVGPRVLTQITDFPDQVNRSCVGYKYPKAQREFSLILDALQDAPLVLSAGVGNTSVAYIDVQWRANDITPDSFQITPPFEGLSVESDSSNESVEIIPHRPSRSRARQSRLSNH